MIGENTWEIDPSTSGVVKLDPADVMTTEEATRLLAPFIKPLPSSSFESVLLSEKTAA
jgi:hypothetical protein